LALHSSGHHQTPSPHISARQNDSRNRRDWIVD